MKLVKRATKQLAKTSNIPDFPAYEEACRILAKLTNLKEIKAIRDQAIGIEEYAKVTRDRALLENAVRVRYVAWSNIGRVIREMQKRGELVRQGQRADLPSGKGLMTLKTIGLTYKQSSNAQWWWRLPERERDRRIDSIVSKCIRSLNAVFRQAGEDARKAALFDPTALVPGLHVGDFRELSPQVIADNSVELVFTDPPYDRDAVPLYGAAAQEAKRILKPGGSMIVYTGQVSCLDAAMRMAEHLTYFWTCACVHRDDATRIVKKGILNNFKPMLWFVKEYRGDLQTFVDDLVSGGKEKSTHEWQQAQSEAEHFIDKLTSPDGTVVDFFVGGGTTLAAAQNLGRKWIGFEIDPVAAIAANNRLRHDDTAA